MYSPSGSKRFLLKRNWAYSGGWWLVVVLCRIVCTEALRPFCALYRCRLLSHVTRDWSEFLNQTELFSSSCTRRYFSAVMDRSSSNGTDVSTQQLFQFLNIGYGHHQRSLTVSREDPHLIFVPFNEYHQS